MKHFALVLISVLTSGAWAQTITYGDLMVKDPVPGEWGKFRVGLIGGYEVTNPYLNTYALGFQTAREFNPHFGFELESVFYNSSKSRYSDKLENDLKLSGVEAVHDIPQQLTTFKTVFHLLAGRVNLLSRTALPFRFNVRGGAGAMLTKANRLLAAGTWGLGPELKVSERVILALGFDQDIQSPFNERERVSRHRLSLSVSWRYN